MLVQKDRNKYTHIPHKMSNTSLMPNYVQHLYTYTQGVSTCWVTPCINQSPKKTGWRFFFVPKKVVTNKKNMTKWERSHKKEFHAHWQSIMMLPSFHRRSQEWQIPPGPFLYVTQTWVWCCMHSKSSERGKKKIECRIMISDWLSFIGSDSDFGF